MARLAALLWDDTCEDLSSLDLDATVNPVLCDSACTKESDDKAVQMCRLQQEIGALRKKCSMQELQIQNMNERLETLSSDCYAKVPELVSDYAAWRPIATGGWVKLLPKVVFFRCRGCKNY